MAARARHDSGQAMVLVAVMMLVMMGFAAIVFDAGLAMTDRRNLQAIADDAALAGARSYLYGGTPASAHFVALQYLAQPLGFAVPLGGCPTESSCPAGTYSSAGYTITLADPATGPLDSALDVSVQHQQASMLGRVLGFGQLNTGASGRATPPGPRKVSAAYAVAAVGGDALINGGGAASQVVGGPVYAYQSYGANNAPHATGTPAVQTNYDNTPCPGNPQNFINNGGTGNNLSVAPIGGNVTYSTNVPVPSYPDADAPVPAAGAPIFAEAVQAKDPSGNWMPGIYNGFAPNAGEMNAGVYKLINVAGVIAPGTNTVYTPSGTADFDGAVVIVLDNTDTGGIDISSTRLNGLDDLYPVTYTGPAKRDPQGTHNFVIWAGNAPNAYTGTVTVGPSASTDMSGIIYMPASTYNSNGNSSPVFTGSLFVKTMTVNGGGNGQQHFNWVCGLASVKGRAADGGLVR